MTELFASMARPFEDPWYRYGRVLDLVARHVPVRPGGAWLDLGCQIGQFIHLVQNRYAVAATGLDQFGAEEIGDICRRHFHIELTSDAQIFTGRWTYRTADLAEPSFGLTERFQCVSALETIEHIIDTDRFIDACRAQLEPRGYLVISTPNINSLRNRVMVPLGRYPAGLEYRNTIHHVRLYNRAALETQMRQHGFVTVRIAGVSFLPIRFLANKAVRAIDPALSDLMPTLCGNLIGIFQRTD